jgi:hypothetical protein
VILHVLHELKREVLPLQLAALGQEAVELRRARVLEAAAVGLQAPGEVEHVRVHRRRAARPERRLRGEGGVEVPRGQAAAAEQLRQAPARGGLRDHAVDVAEPPADGPAPAEAPPLVGEEADDPAVLLQHGHVHVVAHRGDGLRELGAEVGAVEGRIRRLDGPPAGDLAGAELVSGKDSHFHGGASSILRAVPGFHKPKLMRERP